jgi:hypothetical protein
MAWEWSHTNEAYEQVRRELEKKSVKWLAIAWAEFKCKQIEDAMKELQNRLENSFDEDSPDYDGDVGLPSVLDTNPILDGRLEHFVSYATEQAREYGKEHIADWVWEFMSELRTCDNGGHALWACPHGCHKIELS